MNTPYTITYFDKFITRRRLIRAAYDAAAMRGWPKAGFLLLETEQYFAVVTPEDNGYLASILKEPKQHKDSYIEINVTEGHPMYARIHDVCSMLNIAGQGIEVEGVGEACETALYKVILTKEENERLQEV